MIFFTPRCIIHLCITLFLFHSKRGHTQIIQDTVIVDTIEGKANGQPLSPYHQALRYCEPIMYLAFPVIKPLVDRPVALLEGEGKDGYWAEGHFGHRFIIYKGMYYHAPAFQRLRLTFDVSITSRLTRDNSNPLLPFSNKFGIGVDYLLSSLEQLKKGTGGLFWTTMQLHHYSNGQADSFFIDAPEKRNNYKSGDFSSNYWRFLLNVSSNIERKNLYMSGIGFQEEVDMDGPLSSSSQLKNYYGDGRVLFFFQWVKKSKQVVERTNRSSEGRIRIKKQVRRHVGVRTELEYLIGDVSQFPHENKYRLGWHNYLTYLPSVTNEIGLMIHTYVGRDYLNIRFDDVVFAGSVGLYIFFQ